MFRVAYLACVAFACPNLTVPAGAETSKVFTLSADIAAGCLVTQTAGGSWGKVSLGTVSGIQTGTVEADLLSGAVGGLQLECTPGTRLSISADTGNQPSAGVRQLAMAAVPSAVVPYQLYANGSTTSWTNQTVTLDFPIGTSKQTFPVHAKATLPGVQRAGTYTDTVHITLAW